MSFFNKLVIGFFAAFSIAAHADLATDFKALEKYKKGPFSLNFLQGAEARNKIDQGAPKNFQFQAAYRNDGAIQLVNNHSFYVGNLFTTNYYQLMGEFVFGDMNSSHVLDHKAMLERSALAMPKASLMVKHWVLEKFYISAFPSSLLASSFKIRGISGSEFEQEYANYFFNFFLSSISDDFQMLSAILLSKNSPLGDESSSLEKARNLISLIYDDAVANWTNSDNRSRRLWQIRNAIHNQLSKDVILMISKFDSDFPSYRREGRTRLFEVQEILKSYYSVSAKKVAELAKKSGQTGLAATAEEMTKLGVSADRLLELSKLGAQLRMDLASNDKIASDKKASTLRLINVMAQFLNKEVSSLEKIESLAPIKTLVNLAFIEGFLIQSNWEYFNGEVAALTDVAASKQILSDLSEIATETLNQSVSGPFQQWLEIEPKMQNFIDQTLKSSMVNSISLTLPKLQ